MKQLFFLLSLVILGVTTKADGDTAGYQISSWTDLSLYQVFKIKQGPKFPIIWFSHESGKYFLESRLNFDWNGTAAIIAGKTFQKKDGFWITPKAGLFFGFADGGYNGLTFEANFGGKRKHLKYFTMNQVAVSFQKKNPAFFYQYTDIGYDAEYIFISGSFQFYQEMRKDAEPFFDIGPQVMVPIKKFYTKFWYTIDPHPKHLLSKITLGLGYGF